MLSIFTIWCNHKRKAFRSFILSRSSAQKFPVLEGRIDLDRSHVPSAILVGQNGERDGSEINW